MHFVLWLIEIATEVLLLLMQPFGVLLGSIIPNKLLEDKSEVIIVFRWLSKNPLHYLWKSYLEKKGLRVTFLYFPLYKGTFRKSARELKKHIDKNKLKNITLVGISSGGITCYTYLQEYEGWQNIKRFISIGTPFNGSPAAKLFSFLPFIRAITPHNEFLTNLLHEPVLYSKKITCIVANIDELVPRNSSYLKGADIQVMPVLGHNNLHTTFHKTYDLIAQIAKA